MKAKEKRKVRGYKVVDSYYNKALKRAEKEGGALTNIIENVVIAYSYGMDIKAVKSVDNGGRAIDVFTENFSERLSDFKK